MRVPPSMRLLVLVVATLLCAAAAHAQTVLLPTGFIDETLARGGMNRPAAMAFLPDGRMLIAETASGKVREMVRDTLVAAPVAVVDSVRYGDWEQGLLGIALDPRFPAAPYLYVYYTFSGGQAMRLARYRLQGDLAFTGNGVITADPASRYLVLSDMPDMYPVHNGGGLRFGADGLLYVCSGNDALDCTSPSLADPRGKILRLDVSALPDGPGGPPAKSAITPVANPFATSANEWTRLVWLLGLRNPFSLDFDDATGALFIADVGDQTWEEIDRVTSGGLNLGWEYFEGFQRTPYGLSCVQPDTTMGFTFPAYVYQHNPPTGSAVLGGGVIRAHAGQRFPMPASYDGRYVCADGFQRWMRLLGDRGDGSWAPVPREPGQPDSLNWAMVTNLPWLMSSVDVGPDGAIYYLLLFTDFYNPSGELRRIRYTGPASVETPAPSAATLQARSVAGVWELTMSAAPRGAVLSIVDVRGRVVRRWSNSGASPWIVRWNDDAPAGVYFARLTTNAAQPRVVRLVRTGLR